MAAISVVNKYSTFDRKDYLKSFPETIAILSKKWMTASAAVVNIYLIHLLINISLQPRRQYW